MEFDMNIDGLRKANVDPEDGPNARNIMAFMRNANVLVPPEHADDTARTTAKVNLAWRGAERMLQRAHGSQDTTAPFQLGKDPTRAREDVIPAVSSEEPPVPTFAAKKPSRRTRTFWRRG